MSLVLIVEFVPIPGALACLMLEADEVQGVIHQTKDVKIGDASGKIRAPEVAASVIFAEEIHANSVVADAIYAREIHRK